MRRELIGFYEKFARTVLERYKNKVRYWMSFNEINAISGATITSNAVTGAVNAAVYFARNCMTQ